MNQKSWQKLALVIGTAALVAVLMPATRRVRSRRRALPREEPHETGRWESEGGNVPGATLGHEDDTELPTGAAVEGSMTQHAHLGSP